MGLPSWIKRLRAKARRKEANQTSAHSRAELSQRLYLRELEPRRVLNGDMRSVQLDAGQYANDNQADTFVVYRQGDELAARVNGDVVWTAPLTDVNQLTISGSQDDDTFILDESVALLGLPGGIQIHGGGNVGQGRDTLVLQAGQGHQTLNQASYQLQAAGAGSIQLEAVGNGATQRAEVRFVGVQSVSDQLSVASRSFEFTVGQTASDQTASLNRGADGGWQFTSSAGDRLDIAAPTHALTVTAHGTDGLLKITGDSGQSTQDSAQPVQRPLDVTLDAHANRLQFAGSLDLAGGDLTARAQHIDVQGEIVTRDAVVALAAAGEAQVSSAGRIVDVGGRVNVSGSDLAIDGALDARHGQVKLDAGPEGTLLVWGVVDVSGRDAGQTGGLAELLGARVAIFESARIDASGHAGGGQVLMGGDAHGANPDVRNAQYTYVAAGALVTADALAEGNGGRVVVWSDRATRYFGQISARGGAESGDGGWVEVSGASLTMRGGVDLRAPAGATGTLLLDPLRVVLQGGIGDGSDTTASASTLINNPGSNVLGRILFADEGAGSPDPFIITEQEIEDQSLTASIVIEGRDSITVSGVFNYDGDGAGADDPGSNVLLIQGGNNLTLRTRNDAGDGIGGIDLTGVPGLTIKTTGAGSILLHTGVGGSEVGAANIRVGAIATSLGGLTIIAEGATTFSGLVTLGGSLSVTAGGVTQINANLTASSMTFNGGVSLTSSVTLASAGLIDFKQTVDGAFDLTLSGAGSAIARGKVGNSTALGDGVGGSLNLNMNGGMTFEDTVRTLQGLTQADAAGLVTFRDNVNVLGSATATTLNGNVTLDGLTFTSAGAVTFGNSSVDQVTLSDGDATLTITGLLTSNAKVDGARDLVLNTSGGAIFNAAVGGTTAIGDGSGASIQFSGLAGATTFNSTVRSQRGLTQSDAAGLITFRDNVNVLGAGTVSTFDASVTLDGLTFTVSDGTVTFGNAATDQVLLSGGAVTLAIGGPSTINATVNGGQNLILNVAGATAFNASVGATTAIGDGAGASIQIIGAGTTTFSSTVRTQQGLTQSDASGLVTFREDVRVLNAATASAFDANVTLDGLAFTSAGSVTFGNAATDRLTLSGSDVVLSIAGLMTSNARVDGSQDLVLNTTAGATFHATVGATSAIGDGTGASIQFTALAGPTTFGSTVRAAQGLAQDNAAGLVTFRENVTVLGSATASTFNANVTLDGLTFTSPGALTFGNTAADQVLLSGGDVTLTVSGLTTFNAKVDGGQDLILNTIGSVAFHAAVGAVTAIGDGTGPSIQLTILAGATTFSNTVRTQQGLTQHNLAGLLTFRDNVTVLGAGAASSFDADVTLDGLTFTSAGAVTFGNSGGDRVLLSGGDVILAIAGSTISNARIDGARDLVLNSSGATTFAAAVGSATPIGDGAGASIQFTGAGATTFNSTLRTQQGLAQSNGAGLITFRENVNVLGAGTGSSFDADLTLDGLTFTSPGAVTFGNGANDQLTLSGGDVVLTITGLTTSNAKVDGARDLVLNTPGGAIFNAAVGAQTAVGDGTGTSIQMTSVAGATTFNSTVRTAQGLAQDNAAGLVTFRDDVTVLGSGTATTFNANVTLDGLTFTSTGALTFGNASTDQVLLSGGDVTLVISGPLTSNAKIDGGRDLILNSAGATTFNAAVGGVTAIGDGVGASIQFTGGGATTFQSTVRTQQGLTQSDGAGLVTFRDDVIVLGAVAASRFDASVTLDGLTFTSAGAVTLGNASSDQVTLSGGDVILTLGGLLTSHASVDGARDLVLNTSGGATFNGALGSTTAIGDGVGASIRLTSPAGATTFNNTVRTTVGLTQDNAAGLVTFRDNVNVLGAGTASAFNGDLTLDGLNFTSAGAVTFGNAATDQVLLTGGDVTLSVAGLFTSNARVDGSRDLILNNNGVTTFNAAVGATLAIGDGAGSSIQFLGAGATTFNSTLRAQQGLAQSNGAGPVTIREDVQVLGANTGSNFDADLTLDGMTFTSAGAVTFGNANTDHVTLSGGDVTLTISGLTTSHAQIDGARDLVLNTSGGAVFHGALGGSTAIGDGTGASLRFTAFAGPTTFESTVRTQQGMAQDGAAGLVTFRDDVRVLGLSTPTTFDANVALDGLTLTSAGAITFGNGAPNSDSLAITGDVVTIRTTTTIGEITFHSGVTAGSTHVTVNSEAPQTIFDSTWQFTTGRFDVVTGGSMLFTPFGIVRCDVGDIHLFAGFAAGELRMADGAIIDAGAGTMELVARGDVTIGQLLTTNPSNTSLMVTSEEGAIVDGGDTGGADITGPAAILLAQRGIGAGNALETVLQRVAARNANGRDISLDNTSPELRISLLGAVDGVQLDGASGNINILTHGNLIVDRHVVNTAGGNLSLKADSDLTVNDTQHPTDLSVVGAGRMFLTAGRDLALNNDVIATSDTGSITLTADDLPGDLGGRITMQNRTLLMSATGVITLQADGNVVTGQLATATNVMIASNNGAIVDGHIGALDIDIRADQLWLAASRGIGASDTFETSVSKLVARNSTVGDINIENFRDLQINTFAFLDGVQNAGALGSIRLTNRGNLFVGSAFAIGSNVLATGGGNIVLETLSGGVLITHARVAATGGNGNITLDTSAANSKLEIQDSRQLSGGAQLPDIQVTGTGRIDGKVGATLLIGPNVLIQSATGSITNVPPVLTLDPPPQVSALGIATVSGTYGRTEETHFRFTVHWGKSENDGTDDEGNNFYDGTRDGVLTDDDTKEGRKIQEQNLFQPGRFVFTHFYGSNPNSFGNVVDESAKDIDITVRVDTDSHIAFTFNVPPPRPVTQTELPTTFKTPGATVFGVRIDTSPKVPILAFPPVFNVIAVTTTTTAPPTVSQSVQSRGGQADAAATERRRIVLRVVSPDQQGVDREGPDIELQDSVLADLLGLFRSLPDGHYRIYLKETVTDKGRLVIEVYVRQGRPIDPSDETEGDRPPTAQIGPAEVPELVESSTSEQVEGLWARWGSTIKHARLPTAVRATRLKPATSRPGVNSTPGSDASSESSSAAVSPAATVLLAAGALAIGVNESWEDRVDAAFKRVRKISSNRLFPSHAARVRRQLRN